MVTIAKIVLLAAPAVMSIAAAESKTCPRPKDQQGRPLFETLTGRLQSRGVSPGDGHFLTIMPEHAAALVSVSVNNKIYAAAESLSPGTLITLVGYVRHATSGARPGYTCIEIPKILGKKLKG